jgi:hypothetical protein
MPEVIFHGRQAFQIENDFVRLTVLREGGHIAEVFDKRAGLSPLWIPHWDSLEPSVWEAERPDHFGDGADAKLLAGIMGHNVCLDIFGGPSQAEALAGVVVHGEAGVGLYDNIRELDGGLETHLTLRLAQLRFSRSIQLFGENIRVEEEVENLCSFDRPIGWTQHVTFGPPFLDPAVTQFRASVSRSIVASFDPGCDAYLEPGMEFDWPSAPLCAGGRADLRKMKSTSPASGYTAHLADCSEELTYFWTFSPRFKLSIGYIWRREDFPWLGIWEENCSRRAGPWSGREVTRGMEFGVSPFPESRQEMVERGRMFGVPTYRWIPAGDKINVEYWISSRMTEAIPELFAWPAE